METPPKPMGISAIPSSKTMGLIIQAAQLFAKISSAQGGEKSEAWKRLQGLSGQDPIVDAIIAMAAGLAESDTGGSGGHLSHGHGPSVLENTVVAEMSDKEKEKYNSFTTGKLNTLDEDGNLTGQMTEKPVDKRKLQEAFANVKLHSLDPDKQKKIRTKVAAHPATETEVGNSAFLQKHLKLLEWAKATQTAAAMAEAAKGKNVLEIMNLATLAKDQIKSDHAVFHTADQHIGEAIKSEAIGAPEATEAWKAVGTFLAKQILPLLTNEKTSSFFITTGGATPENQQPSAEPNTQAPKPQDPMISAKPTAPGAAR